MLKKYSIKDSGDINKLSFNFIYSFFLLFCLTFLPSLNITAQNITDKIVSVDAKDTSVGSILETIYKQYNIKLAFNSKELKNIEVKEYKAENQTIDNVLRDLLNNTGYSYKPIGNLIAIYKDDSNITENTAKSQKNKKTSSPPSSKPKETLKDTIHHTDTVMIIKTIHDVDTVRITVKEVDTLFIYKKPTTKAKLMEISKNLFAKDYSHNKKFSLRLAYSQQYSWLDITGKKSVNKEYLSQLKESINMQSLNNVAINLDGGYTFKNWDFTVGISYNSYRHKFSFNAIEWNDPYYVIDTIDRYSKINPITGDTIYFYLIDSTYTPGTQYRYKINDNNHISYFGINMATSYTFYKTERMILYLKAAANVDFLISANGSYIIDDSNYDRVQKLNKDVFEKTKFTYLIGLGSRIALTESIDIVPEIYYKHYCRSIIKDSSIKIKNNILSLKIGINYYF